MRTWTPWCSLVLVWATTVGAQQPCDPTTSDRPTPVPEARRLGATCGNGKIDAYATSCSIRSSGGCGHPSTTTLVCEPGEEVCDGAALGGLTCEGLEFGGGKLGCKASCLEYDTSGCMLCARGQGKTCRELVLRGPLAPSGDFRVLAAGGVLRAFWLSMVHDTSHLVTAVLRDDLSGLQGTPIDVGYAYTDPIAMSGGWFFLLDDEKGPILRMVDLQGTVRSISTGITGPSAQLRVLTSEASDRVLVVAGNLEGALQVALFDGAGVRVPLLESPLYVHGRFERAVLAPLPQGPVSVTVGSKKLDVVAVKGDQLFSVIHTTDTCVGGGCFGLAALLREGKLTERAMAYALEPPVLEVTSTGGPKVRFDPAGDVVGAQTFAPKRPPPAGFGPFGAFARAISRVETSRGTLLVAAFQHGLVDGERGFSYRVALARE